MSRPAAVLFDMDGTLIDSEKQWTIALDDYAAHLGGVLSSAARESMVGSSMNTSMGVLLGDIGRLATEAHVAEAFRWVEARMAELFREGLHWRPGAQNVLKAVRGSGYPTALVTSTARSLTEIALDTLGRDAFDATVCGDEVGGKNKPDPEPYLRACRLLGVTADACIAIEDSPTGVAAAEAAGCKVIAVPCEVPLRPGPRRVLLDSLEGVDVVSAVAELG